MKLSPQKDVGLAALAALLGGLSYVNAGRPAEAATWCYEQTGCAGQAGCSQGGTLQGCMLTCTGGGEAVCRFKSGSGG